MSKDTNTLGYPVLVKEANGLLKRIEPILTPAKFRDRFLLGLEQIIPYEIKDSTIKDRINIAINELEMLLKMPVMPEEIEERIPFDSSLYRHFIHTKTTNRILSLEDFSIVSANGQNLFRIPPDWIDLGQAHIKQLNVIPLLATTYGARGSVTANITPGGTAYLLILERSLGFVPSYWTIKYTTGLCKEPGQMPVIVNELIGILAAQNLLSNLAPINKNNSISLSQDGIGQSSSNPGVQIFAQRLQELEMRKQSLLGQLKRVFSQKMFFTNI